MAKTINKENLEYLGTDFQFKLVKCFIEDQKFFINLQHIIDQNMFTVEPLRRIVGFMKDRYSLNETVANYFEIETIVRSKVSDAISVEEILSTLKKIEQFDLVGMDLVENESEKFFKQQNLTKAINKAQEIIKKGDASNYYIIEDLIKKALETNTKQDYGYHVFDNMEDVLKEDYRCAIPTGATKLDDMLYGGLAKGELGIIIAPSGVGKSSATTGFAAHAATYKCEANNYKGFKVLHIHFEDEDKNIKRKYYGYITQIEACELSKPDIRPRVIEIINNNNCELKNMIQENVICMHPQSGEMSASEIKKLIKQLIARGFKPDLVIVDYFECLKLEASDNQSDKEWTREGITMRKLESIAHEFDLALWCPVQGTKDSIGVEFVGMNQAGGSVKKVQIGHVIVTFARTPEQAKQGRMNVFLSKFRGGKLGGALQNVIFNNGTCRFNMEESDEIDAVDFEKNYQTNSNNLAREVRDSQRKK